MKYYFLILLFFILNSCKNLQTSQCKLSYECYYTEHRVIELDKIDLSYYDNELNIIRDEILKEKIDLNNSTQVFYNNFLLGIGNHLSYHIVFDENYYFKYHIEDGKIVKLYTEKKTEDFQFIESIKSADKIYVERNTAIEGGALTTFIIKKNNQIYYYFESEGDPGSCEDSNPKYHNHSKLEFDLLNLF